MCIKRVQRSMDNHPESHVFVETTKGIRVAAVPEYLPAQSDPEEGSYVWAYHIRIENHTDASVQLLSRHWMITDGFGGTQEVKGDGVIGKQPVIPPGKHFGYSSGTQLNTPSGLMKGIYHMVGREGAHFDIAVPVFSLDSPDQLKMAN